jgi:hypothetical protein
MFDVTNIKKKVYIILLTALLITITTGPLFAIDISISVENILNTADRLNLVVKIRYNKSIEQIYYQESDIKPDQTIDLGNHIITAEAITGSVNKPGRSYDIVMDDEVVYNSSADGQYITDKIVYTFQVFEIDDIYIKPLRLSYRLDEQERDLYTQPIPILSRKMAVIRNEQGQIALRGLKAPFGDESVVSPIIIILSILALVMVVLLIVLLILRKKKTEPEKPPMSPLEEALDRLHRLKHSTLVSDGMVKEYYIQLSHIVRRFLAYKLHLTIMESPTDKVREMLGRSIFDPELVNRVVGFLKQCDRIKFAKYIPPESSIESDFERAYDIVTSFREREPELVNA